MKFILYYETYKSLTVKGIEQHLNKDETIQISTLARFERMSEELAHIGCLFLTNERLVFWSISKDYIRAFIMRDLLSIEIKKKMFGYWTKIAIKGQESIVIKSFAKSHKVDFVPFISTLQKKINQKRD